MFYRRFILRSSVKMSDQKSVIDVYYEQGEILHGPNGVDLSNFNAIQRAVSNPEEKFFNALYKWLIRIFQIDETVEKLNVCGLVS